MLLQPVYLSPEKPREVAPAPVYRSSLASDAYTHLREKSYLTQKFDYFPRTDTHKKVHMSLHCATAALFLSFVHQSHTCDYWGLLQVVYEVTLEIDEDIVEDYLDWIRSGHIQGEEPDEVNNVSNQDPSD